MIESINAELKQFPKRLTRKQKQPFLDYVSNKFNQYGYDSHISTGRYFVKSKNLETVNDTPDLIIGAHYDTPTILPFYFEYLFKIFGHTRQIVMLIAIFILAFGFSTLFAHFYPSPALQITGTIIQIFIYLPLLGLLIPNPKNYNDNTSGVLTVLGLAERLAEKPELHKRVKFILFDNEELGLLGSLMQRKKWNKETPQLNNTPLITIDCVGRGNYPVIIKLKKDSDIADNMKKIFLKQKNNSHIKRLSIYPFSDNFAFSHGESINISMMDNTLIPGGYYIKKIHSPKDHEINLKNIKLVTDSLEQYIKTETARRKGKDEVNDH